MGENPYTHMEYMSTCFNGSSLLLAHTHTHTHCALHVSYLSKHASLLTSILFQNSITPPHISCR